ncbi:hypothetical protein [Nostoc sp. WHI]|nr:hypothetical protein [Nostoc sp. WHI]
MSDLVFLPAHQLAQMICDRQVSAVEVFDGQILSLCGGKWILHHAI